MRAAPSPRPLHPVLAALMALSLHGLLLSSGGTSPQSPSSPQLFDIDAALEVTLGDDIARPSLLIPQAAAPPHAVPPSPPIGSLHARSRDAARERRVAAHPAPRARVGVGAETAEDDAVELEPSASSSGSAVPRAIDLGLNGGVRRSALLGGWVELPSAAERPSDGGLSQGLAALDAERGLSRSSAAHSAAYTAARQFAPALGIGIFEVLADERGSVLSVTLLSAASDEARWERVGQELQRLLKERRLRVPPGAKGLVARLRVETGELAKSLAERFRTERGAALGEGPIHPREIRAESTRKSLEPGQLSPTLGVGLASGGSNPSIRVVLLDEHAI